MYKIKTDLNSLNGRYVAKPRMKEEQVATVRGEAVIRLSKYKGLEFIVASAWVPSTDQPDIASTVRTSTRQRSTALYINENWLMYRALYLQICSSDQLLRTLTSLASTERRKTKKILFLCGLTFPYRVDYTERRKTKRKKGKCPKSKFIGST